MSNLLGFWQYFLFGPQLFCPLTSIVIPYLVHECIIWDDMSHTFLTSVWPWTLASISKLFLLCVCVGKTVLSHNKFGLFVYHHETKYVDSWYISMIFDLKVNIRRVWVNKRILKYMCIAIRYFLWMYRNKSGIFPHLFLAQWGKVTIFGSPE